MPAAEDPKVIDERQPDKFMAHFFWRIFHGPGHKVDRTIGEGDEVAGFQVLDVPGHSAGHVAFWRESDRVLILGDVLANMDQYTGIPGLNEPKPALTPDRAEPGVGAQARGAGSPSWSASATARPCATRGSCRGSSRASATRRARGRRPR